MTLLITDSTAEIVHQWHSELAFAKVLNSLVSFGSDCLDITSFFKKYLATRSCAKGRIMDNCSDSLSPPPPPSSLSLSLSLSQALLVPPFLPLYKAIEYAPSFLVL